MSGYIILVVCLIVFVGVGFIYNNAIKLRNYVREAFSTMDVYLKKRWDLIPNLVEIVKGYANHEREVFEKITSLRSKSYYSMSNSEKMNVNSELTMGLAKLIAIAENYPDLKANENFAQLSRELTNIEDDIANARRYYNGTVRELNNYVECFPSNIICAFFNIKEEKLFEIEETQRNNVKVEL